MLSSHQISMVSLEQLVSKDHQYRKFKSLFNFQAIEAELLAVESAANYKGYGVLRLFKCLLLQFMEDMSDRELERYLADSTAGKWFCDFSLTEATPDHSVFSRMRKKIGSNLLSKIFAILERAIESSWVYE